MRRDPDGMFSFLSCKICQKQNKKGRQQNKAGVQNNHAVVCGAGESGTVCLCKGKHCCISKKLGHRGFLLS